MKIVYFLAMILLLISPMAFGNVKEKIPLSQSLDQDARAYEFFQKYAQAEKSNFSYNRYENIISGIAAFAIGNVGYLTTESTSLKLTYSAVQTIGIINIGQGIYTSQAPAVNASLRDILSDSSVKSYSKEKLAGKLLKIFAQEDRAKRLSIFYSSSFLTLQYAMNATIYKSSGQLKKTYLFLGGVNAIVAAYSAFNKSKYEEAFYGNKMDLSPFAALNDQSEPVYGLGLSYRY